MLNIYEPYLLDSHKKSARDAIETGWISNYGLNVKNSEELLKKILGVKHVILTNNGTSATHCLFLGLKYKYPNINKIYVPNNVFVAAWNCALMEYSKENLDVLRVDEETLNMDTSEEYIMSLEQNSCVLVVHNLGNIVNVPRLARLRPDIVFVEDNCEGMFGKYEGFYSGTHKSTLCSSCSFYANKTLTTGEGGAFFTNDTDLYKYISKVYSHGMTSERYIHDVMAYNFRMTNIQAGFLYDQLNDLENILDMKRQVFSTYDKMLNIKRPRVEQGTVPADWMYCIITPINYTNVETFMSNKLVQIRPFFYDIRRHEHLKDGIKVDQEELKVFQRGVMLPSYPGLTTKEQEYICNCLKEKCF